MTQTYEKTIIISFPEVEEQEIQAPMESEADELLGDLNPQYYEESISFKNAKQRIIASDINAGSKFNFFSTF
jgi:hypothetical protein